MTSRSILRPIITSKSTMAAQGKCYTFLVERTANKHKIALDFQELYGGKVISVNVANLRPHSRRTRKGIKRFPKRKKAYITAKDVELDLFPTF